MVAEEYPTLISYLSPTHTIRTKELFEQAKTFAKKGGMIDISTGGTRFQSPHLCVLEALECGVSIEQMTFSSDGRGGVKKVDPVTGEFTYTPAPLHLNWKEMTLLVKEGKYPMEDALRLITVNPAKNMKLNGKGRIQSGYDADFCFLDENLNISDVIAKGELMMKEYTIIKKGRYEQ
ncbi:hypothetical protein FACS189416_7910 [Bacteroidia bacterium]|nr:hypothetical protein FACS189416_7910 [Bacteroidia bacterium]